MSSRGEVRSDRAREHGVEHGGGWATPPAQLTVTEKVLFYRASTGASSIGSFAADGTYVQDSAPAFSAGWTQITCTHAGEILSYNATSGLYAIGQIDDAGQWHTTGSSGTIGTGWEQVVATGNTWVVLKKTVTVPGQGLAAQYELREVLGGVVGSSPLTTGVVLGEQVFDLAPALSGLQLMYAVGSGVAAFVAWRSAALVPAFDVDPDPAQARVLLRWYPRGFSTGWAHIVSLGAL